MARFSQGNPPGIPFRGEVAVPHPKVRQVAIRQCRPRVSHGPQRHRTRFLSHPTSRLQGKGPWQTSHGAHAFHGNVVLGPVPSPGALQFTWAKPPPTVMPHWGILADGQISVPFGAPLARLGFRPSPWARSCRTCVQRYGILSSPQAQLGFFNRNRLSCRRFNKTQATAPGNGPFLGHGVTICSFVC